MLHEILFYHFFYYVLDLLSLIDLLELHLCKYIISFALSDQLQAYNLARQKINV